MIHSAAVLSFVDVSLRRGSRALLTGVSFTLHAGEKLGVVGDNGSGKSTLLAAVTGELAPDTGNVQMPSGSIVAHVAQERVADERPAIEHVLDGDTELRALEAALDRARGDGDGNIVIEIGGGG